MSPSADKTKPCFYLGTSLIPLGVLPDPKPSSFNQEGSSSTYQSHFCRGFPRCHYHLHFCFCRHRRPWVLEMQGTVPIRLGEKGTAGGVGTPSENTVFPSLDGGAAPAPCSPSQPRRYPSTLTRLTLLRTRWRGARCDLKSHLNQKFGLGGLFLFFFTVERVKWGDMTQNTPTPRFSDDLCRGRMSLSEPRGSSPGSPTFSWGTGKGRGLRAGTSSPTVPAVSPVPSGKPL